MSDSPAEHLDSDNIPTPWKPNPWLAALLGVLAPLGLLYVGRFRMALYYLLIAMVIGAAQSLSLFEGLGLPRNLPLTTVLIVVCAVHSVYLAISQAARIHRPWYSRWYGLVGFYVSIFLVAFIFRSFLFEPFIYPYATMVPAVKPQARILVQKWGYGNYGSLGLTILRTGAVDVDAVNRGDVVAFELPEDHSVQLVARVIGLPGERVVMREDGVMLNGEPLEHETKFSNRNLPYNVITERAGDTSYDVFYPKHNFPGDAEIPVPPGSYLLLGDNRTITVNDKLWILVPRERLIGKVVATW